MSDESTTGNTPREIPGLDDTIDPAERDVRISEDEGDDLPVTPPDSVPRGGEWNTSPADEATEETIDQRIAQEEPDPHSAYGAPDNESGLDGPEPIGGDDPDAIPSERDVLADGEVLPLDQAVDAPAEEAALRVEDDLP